MIKYKTGTFAKGLIEPVEVVSETEKFVTYETTDYAGKVHKRRESKDSWGGKYFDTWEEAHEYLLEKTHEKIEQLLIALKRAESDYETIKGLKKPE